MKAIIQRSGKAKVEINNQIVGKIESGIVILLGITNEDKEKDIEYVVNKIINLRIFENEGKDFEISIKDADKEALVISQFTLYANVNKGRRPDFNEAAKSDIAKPIYEKFIKKLKENGIKVATGEFGADMEVHLNNRGPVTIIIDSHQNQNG